MNMSEKIGMVIYYTTETPILNVITMCLLLAYIDLLLCKGGDTLFNTFVGPIICGYIILGMIIELRRGGSNDGL